MLWVDHIICAVADLDEAAERFARDPGLRSFSGGLHPQGTENRVVPLRPPQYLELIAIHDHERNAADPWGRVLADFIRQGGGLVAWGVGTDDVAAVAARTGADLVPGSIERDDGSVGSWRSVDPPDDEGGALPFVIQYDDPALTREREQWARFRAADHPCRAEAVAWVEVCCPQRALDEWLGAHELPIRVGSGPPGLRRVGLQTERGQEVVLG